MSVPAMQPRRSTPATMNIGHVLTQLRPEFPEISISKIRFLEDQGLIHPVRTATGYRKFSSVDVERLRYILSVQRDKYLPLRVIREHLQAVDRGEQPPAIADIVAPRRVADVNAPDTVPAQQRMTRADLIAASGISEQLCDEAENYGLITADSVTGYYDAQALTVLTTAAQLAAYGIAPRHLRAFRAAADREAGLVEQVVSPLRHQHRGHGEDRAHEVAREVACLTMRLHAALLEAAITQTS